MPLIKGENLNEKQRRQVLNSYVYRWTVENWRNVARAMHCGCSCEQQPCSDPSKHAIAPLETDEEWLKSHAFYFLKDGSRLMNTHHHCVPAWYADTEGAI